MPPIVTDHVAWSVGLSVCHSVTPNPCKTAEPIEMPFGLWTRVVPRKHLLDGAPVDPFSDAKGQLLGYRHVRQHPRAVQNAGHNKTPFLCP